MSIQPADAREPDDTTAFAAQSIPEPVEVVAGSYRLHRLTTIVSGDRTATYPERPDTDKLIMEPPC
ncbi:hypothetical protein SEA_LISARA_43 [Arthrobacter phage LiSara]|uniref:Uncharacterized protein n=1 Tax=Arthrobacter phage LiSara TaxID=2015860 RepID=A0A222ZFV3_9CAUD|nr:hypothetical protein KMD21_gp43 [Arthrobacter phage LiSara]ASR83627.1 hypothetical protein SEA_LISARA_43 [Arthrobacter phage LiSara]